MSLESCKKEKLFDLLEKDVHYKEGMNACINCGTCTAICPAASFYKYDPRQILAVLQNHDEDALLDLLKSEQIWYCGECMSCKTRCPRGNTPGLVIIALRSLSQESGYFTESEKGRQQIAIKRTIGKYLWNYGYCVYPLELEMKFHPEQGPTFAWALDNVHAVFQRLGANLAQEGPGVLRKIPEEAMEELHRIFEVTGATGRFEKIEEASRKKAEEMKMDFSTDGLDNEYCTHVFSANNNTHTHL